MSAADYLNMVKGVIPDYTAPQNPYAGKVEDLAQKTQPTKADMLAALGFGMAAAPTSDPWRALGIGGMAALTVKQDGMTRYQSALTNLSNQYEDNSRHQGQMAQTTRVNQLNAALKYQELDQAAKGVPRPGTTVAEQAAKLRTDAEAKMNDIRAKSDMDMPPEEKARNIAAIQAGLEEGLAYLQTGTRSSYVPGTADAP
jgi:hypothetical protein